MFSVRLLTLLPLRPGRDVGLGKLEAVPGMPEAWVPARTSSVRCELVITDLSGFQSSSLCSPLLTSQSTLTAAR